MPSKITNPPNTKVITMPKSLNESLVSTSPPTSTTSSIKEPIARQSPSGDAKPGSTFAHQDDLPKLPIQELQDTCRKYLDAVRPLQTPREHQETKAAVREFLKTDGPELHERLKKYASSKSSYIEQFCMLSRIFALRHFFPRVFADRICRVRFILEL